MRLRAGIILISDNKIALMKRTRPDKTFYVVPGGGIDDGEYSDEAAIREAQEELGISVEIDRLLFVVERVEYEQVTHLQMYYLVTQVDGVFGSGIGEEYQRSIERGSYEALWMPLEDVRQHHCYPSVLVDYILEKGLPKEIVHMREEHNYPRRQES